ncbi:hypothetical protein ABG79_00361 [Caloramator mitchellensis]|uniref:Uncharacterized protein n=1 Tax=Caloramator mitchellensis TaxID=908809 RepID=A0A0R3JVI6_CALMK|nr:hypothetical protein ABG79_00361 [Caloramator mitchellensis]
MSNTELFIQVLENRDMGLLKRVPKTDSDKHSINGCLRRCI